MLFPQTANLRRGAEVKLMKDMSDATHRAEEGTAIFHRDGTQGAASKGKDNNGSDNKSRGDGTTDSEFCLLPEKSLHASETDEPQSVLESLHICESGSMMSKKKHSDVLGLY